MNPLAAVIVLILAAAGAAMAQTSKPAWQKIEGGELILRPFANAPFPHASGQYTDATVAVFIPDNFNQTDFVNYVVHLHGHKNSVANVLKQYKLPEQLAAAKVNAILIVPQGPLNAADSGGGKLEEAGGFNRLISEITRFLRTEKKTRAAAPGLIVLSAHSGGYKVASRILYHGGLGRQITDVLLLDAAYGELAPFANFCRVNRDIRLVSLYTDHLADENKQLMGMMDGMSVKYHALDENALKDADLQSRSALFIPTSAKHDEIPLNYFQRLLRTSALGERPGSQLPGL